MTYISHTLHSLPGVRKEDLIGKRVSEFWPAKHRTKIAELYRGVLKDGTSASYRADFPVSTGRRVLSHRLGPLRTSDGIDGVVIVSQDITEQLEMQARMLHDSKLASIGGLAAGVGHEINNPLMVLVCEVTLLRAHLKEEGVLDRDTTDRLDTLDRITAQIGNIVDGLRTFVAPGGDATSFSLHEALRKTVRLVEGIHGFSRIAMHWELNAERDLVAGDVAQFQPVTMNLLSNARDALERARHPVITITTRTLGEDILLDVHDNGCGIAADRIEGIFDAFFTTKTADQGMGLGLNISRSIITQQMKGAISVTSEPDHGAIFHLRLPLAEPQPETTPAIASTQTLQGKTLLVDDDPDVLEAVAQLLEQIGLTVSAVSDGVKALALLKFERFDFLLTDQKMDDMTGDELIRRFAEFGASETACFIISGWVDPHAVDQVRDIGGVNVRWIRKPVTAERLQRILAGEEKS